MQMTQLYDSDFLNIRYSRGSGHGVTLDATSGVRTSTCVPGNQMHNLSLQ